MEGLDVRPDRDPGLSISYKISRLLRKFGPILQLLYLGPVPVTSIGTEEQ